MNLCPTTYINYFPFFTHLTYLPLCVSHAFASSLTLSRMGFTSLTHSNLPSKLTLKIYLSSAQMFCLLKSLSHVLLTRFMKTISIFTDNEYHYKPEQVTDYQNHYQSYHLGSYCSNIWHSEEPLHIHATYKLAHTTL